MPENIENSNWPPIEVNKWPEGIAQSPYLGFAEIRNLDVVSHPGTITLTPKLGNTISSATTGTFTADASTDILTGPNLTQTIFGTTYSDIRVARFTTTVTLPAGLSLATTYFLVLQSPTTYKVSTTLANALSSTFVNITDAGTGTHTITTIDPGYFKYFATDKSTTPEALYALDVNGRVWKQVTTNKLWYLIDGNTLTSQNANGFNIFQGKFVVFRNTAVDYATVGTSPSWSTSGTPLTNATGQHVSWVTQDNILYFGNDDGSSNPYIGTITTSSITINANALSLPKYKIVTALSELGLNLIIGTIGYETYQWNRSDTVLSTLPIICAEKNITALLTVNNQLFAGAGNKGNLYKFNGYFLELFKPFPKHLLFSDYGTATIGAMAVLGRKLLYTIQTIGNSGVWSVDMYDKERALVMENTVSGAVVGINNALIMPALYSDGNGYYASWSTSNESVNTFGVDTTLSDSLGTQIFPITTSAYFVTALYTMGFIKDKRNLKFLEAYLDRPFASTMTMVLYYRTKPTGSFTSLVTFSGDDATQVLETLSVNAIAGTHVQFKMEVNGTATTSPFLQNLRIL